MDRVKIRIRFRKAGDLRWTSHHDLLRCFERMLRRAQLPFRSTEGFNPRPRLTFAQPLPLGVIGCNELVDLELDQEMPAAQISTRLASQAPPGLTVLDVERIGPRAALQVCGAVYRLPVPDECTAAIRARAAALLGAQHCFVERQRPHPRTVDILPFLSQLSVVPGFVELHLAVTPHGGARPEEVLRLLDLGDILESGAVVERTNLVLAPEASTAATTGTSSSCHQEKESDEERNVD